jgi:hypothetical protein
MKWRGVEMKGRDVALVVAFCVASLVASSGLAVKPNKPGKPTEPHSEWIAFTGDFVGCEEVEGCCPNAGPNPAYDLTVARDLPFSEDPDAVPLVHSGTYTGHIFMNSYGTGQNRQYIVKYWGSDSFGHTIAIGIIGGEIDNDRRNKILTVTFTGEDCYALDSNGQFDYFIDAVSFTLVRAQTLTCP